jgi:WD40 repeat protein
MRWTLGLALVATATLNATADAPKAPTIVGNAMGAVAFLRYSPNGKELVRICQFGGVELFDTAAFDALRTFPTGMRMISFHPDGTRIASAEGTDGARIWDAASHGRTVVAPAGSTLREISVLETPLHVLETPSSAGASSVATRRDKQRVFRAEFSPDGGRVVTTQADGHAKVWKADGWTLEADLPLGTSELRAAAFAPDGKTLVVGGVDGVLHAWNFERKEDVPTTSAHGAVMELVFTPDGRSLLSVHRSKPGSASVVFWDDARKVVEAREGWSAVAVSSDGKRMALGGSRVELIDPVSHRTLRSIDLPSVTLAETNAAFAQEPGANEKIPLAVVALAFSPDGATLAAGCQDGTIRLIPLAP